HRAAGDGRGPLAELPVRLAPPPVGGPPGRDPARVPAAGAPRGESDAARHKRRARLVGRGTVAELAIVVQAPAIGGTRGGDPAGVEGAGTHCDEAHAAGHRAAREALAGLLSGNGVTELAVTIESPAVASASGRDAAGVEDPGV